jgi:hypothetical protein
VFRKAFLWRLAGQRERPKTRLGTVFTIGPLAMTDEEEHGLRAKLAQLRQEHGDLDAAISAMTGSARCDQLQLTRLKKRKLQLKDQIAQIEDSLLPDITA